MTLGSIQALYPVSSILYPVSIILYLVSCIHYLISCIYFLVSLIHYLVSCIYYLVSCIYYVVSNIIFLFCIQYLVSYSILYYYLVSCESCRHCLVILSLNVRFTIVSLAYHLLSKLKREKLIYPSFSVLNMSN